MYCLLGALVSCGLRDIHNQIGVNVVGIKHAPGAFTINPGPETTLDLATKLFVLGNADQIRLLNEFLGIQSPSL